MSSCDPTPIRALISEKSPQDDAVRRAAATCVDRDAIVAVIGAGAATLMKTIN